VKVQEILQRPQILLDVKPQDKDQLITLLARFLASAYGLPNADTIVSRMLEREATVSTGIGLGIAIPHCRMDGIDKPCMVAARTETGMDYDAIDELPVRLVFMMVSPTNTVSQHGEVLSRLSRIMADEKSRNNLLAAQSPEEFLAAVAAAEDQLA
jgi:fructose PTS system EIIBC or EIIC component